MRLSLYRRIAALTAALAILATTAASGGTWRCLDGTLCLTDCGMGPAHGAAATIAATPTSCGECPESTTASPGSFAGKSLRTASQCVLSADDRSPASVVDRIQPATPAALPDGFTLAKPARVTAGYTYLPLRAFDRVHSGSARAPPFAS